MTMKISLEGEEITWDELFKRIDDIQLAEYKRAKWSKVFKRMP